ncbi:MAG: class IV adenylate cyclase [Bacteroidales bacterium]|nr:class IV adenylate cyclase [Bacteroidales bacterium]
MARNIEIKARISDIRFCLDKARNLSGDDPEIIKQEDTFFKCERGRLKLRILSPEYGELILYNRTNYTGPKTSEYYISPSTSPHHLLNVLTKAYGIHGKVNKIRRLFIVGRSRIHVDQVDNLGNFLEFEVVMNANEKTIDGEKEAYRLMNTFNIKPGDLISGAYIDLIKNIL